MKLVIFSRFYLAFCLFCITFARYFQYMCQRQK